VDRAEVFGMKLKVVREGDAVRATEGGDQVGIVNSPSVLELSADAEDPKSRVLLQHATALQPAPACKHPD
jgi:hypothetical protein